MKWYHTTIFSNSELQRREHRTTEVMTMLKQGLRTPVMTYFAGPCAGWCAAALTQLLDEDGLTVGETLWHGMGILVATYFCLY